MKKIQDFQKKIHYFFTEEGLLRQALTHSSYANEKHMNRQMNNERLEFLGDAVLQIASAVYLYQQFPDLPEGDLTRMRASIVCEPTLARDASALSLGDFLLLGKGEEQTGGRSRKSILSDALEAVIGAIYLDGGYERAESFILCYILNDLENKQLFYDSKSILQEEVQKVHGELMYELIGEEGPPHRKTYTVRVVIDGKALAQGEGSTKKAAEQEAAYQTLLQTKKESGYVFEEFGGNGI